MYLRLETSEETLKVINNALISTLNTYPTISYDNKLFYKVSSISSKALKQIGWICEYYPETTIEISDNLNV